ncbi:hypothetical protein GUJ93_ZPchr0005g15362 [Zizania palustris]|uniref:Uncharacterized protein n=1 Tax=Zizania palustris TaxID=103762 RepID=A0A8J5SVP1_ZIZPA|nr:hypothetical protein GUJ93_ZPchr0005g15362 [Zizania palustris]
MSIPTASALPSPPPCRFEAPCSSIRIASSGASATAVQRVRATQQGECRGNRDNLVSSGASRRRGRSGPSPQPRSRAASRQAKHFNGISTRRAEAVEAAGSRGCDGGGGRPGRRAGAAEMAGGRGGGRRRREAGEADGGGLAAGGLAGWGKTGN